MMCTIFRWGGESNFNAQRSGFYEKFGFFVDLGGSMFSMHYFESIIIGFEITDLLKFGNFEF